MLKLLKKLSQRRVFGMLHTLFNQFGLDSLQTDSQSSAQTGESDRFYSASERLSEGGQGDASGFFSMSDLTPGFTAEAFTQHITDLVRNLAIQQRFGEALHIGETHLDQTTQGSPDTLEELNKTLAETREARDEHEMKNNTIHPDYKTGISGVSYAGAGLEGNDIPLRASFGMAGHATRPLDIQPPVATPQAPEYIPDTPQAVLAA